MDDLVSTEWLAGQLGSPGLRIVDASAHLPDAARDPAAEFATGHIPGALFLDLPSLKNADSPVPSALPSSAQFAARMDAIGIAEGDRVVIYDDSDVKTSARAWFIFRMHGAERVAILDGGLGKWRSEGRPLEIGAPASKQRGARFAPTDGPGDVRFKADMLANIASGIEQVVDARGGARFRGEAPDFRPGVAEGHIPGSRNLPFGEVLNEDGTFKDNQRLRGALAQGGIDLDRPVVTTCGSGVTASVLLFAMHLLGKDDVALYDGSWSEWGADPATPKATGPAT